MPAKSETATEENALAWRHRCATECARPIHPIQLNELRLLAVRTVGARAVDAVERRASTRVCLSRTHTRTHVRAEQTHRGNNRGVQKYGTYSA